MKSTRLKSTAMKTLLVALLGTVLLTSLTGCETGGSGAVYAAPNANANRIR